jgi:CubicO group peptidase (beta-lactamase class C family)
MILCCLAFLQGIVGAPATESCPPARLPACPPEVVQPASLDWRPLARLVDSAVEAGAAPGAVVAISIGGVQYIHGAGRLGIGDTVRPDPATIYDLASLTKVIGLTTGLMLAVTEGRIELDAPVQRYVPGFICSPIPADCATDAGSGRRPPMPPRPGRWWTPPHSIPSPARAWSTRTWAR